MTKFSPAQKAKCIIWLAELHDIESVQKNFKEEFVDNEQVARVPAESEILSWYNNFNVTGEFDPNLSSIDLNGTDDNRRIDMDIHSVDYEKANGFLSSIGLRKFHKSHPYKMHLYGDMKMEDFVERKNFAQFQLDHLEAHNLNQFWFGGEATFYLNGRVECHNLVYLYDQPDTPEDKIAPLRMGSQVTVWAAINSEGLIGPYIYVGEPNLKAYQLFLRKFVYELRQTYRYKHVRKPLFIQDDAPLHNHSHEYLESEFPNHWIGPGSDYSTWPRLSPDINPLCFFLWGHIKSHVYEQPMLSDDVAELEFRIHEAFMSVRPNMLKQVWDDYLARLKQVIEKNGSLIDVHHDYENVSIQNDLKAMRWVSR